MLAVGLLAACGNEKATEVEDVDTPSTETQDDGPTREEMNEEMKAEAKEYSFVEFNGDEVVENEKVKLSGEVSSVQEEGMMGEFTLSTKEGDGYGMYAVINMLGAEFNEGDTVIVYGAYDGKNDSGMPLINATIIEVE